MFPVLYFHILGFFYCSWISSDPMHISRVCLLRGVIRAVSAIKYSEYHRVKSCFMLHIFYRNVILLYFICGGGEGKEGKKKKGKKNWKCLIFSLYIPTLFSYNFLKIFFLFSKVWYNNKSLYALNGIHIQQILRPVNQMTCYGTAPGHVSHYCNSTFM